MQLQKRISNLLTQMTIGMLLILNSITCETIYATCNIRPNSQINTDEQVTGVVDLMQEKPDGKTKLEISLSGFNTGDETVDHGFHVHESDDMSDGCNSLGGHYNPDNYNHASPDSPERHVGDLGNVKENAEGKVSLHMSDSWIQLSGQRSVMGRSIVVHEMRDDLGLGGNAESLRTGNAGRRLACCIITETSKSSTSRVSATLLLSVLLLMLYRLM